MQLSWLVRGLRTGIVPTSYPSRSEALPPGFRGLPVLDEKRCQAVEGCHACVEACLPGAIALDTPSAERATFRLDLGACIMCGLCVSACPNGAMAMSPGFELATTNPRDLVFSTHLSSGGHNGAAADVHAN